MNEEKIIASVCRVCLRPRMKKYRSLFEKYKNCSLYDHINILTNIEIKVNDGFPDTICFSCFLELETALSFKEKCEKSNFVLKSKSLEKIIGPQTSTFEVLIKKEPQHATDDLANNCNDGSRVSADYPDDDSLNNDIPFACVDIKRDVDSRNHSLDAILQCHDCGSYFKSKCKLRVHWKRTHLLSSLICPLCKMAFKSYKAYHTHIKTKRKSCMVAASGAINIVGIGKARMFNCKECPYKTKRMKDIQNHLVVHSGDRPFQCEMCSNTFTQLSSLQAHKETVHKKYKVEVTCHFCGKFIRGRTQVYRHLKSHTEDKIPCPICKKLLTKKSHKPHMQRHSGTKSYTCETCASTFYTCAELCNHRRSIHNKHRYVYKCDLCAYMSNRSDTMKRHKKKHTDINIPCVTCGMFFLSTQKLSIHERIHFEEKKHLCPHCDAKFHGRDSVRKHIRVKHKLLTSANHKSTSVTVKEEMPVVEPYCTDDNVNKEYS